MNNIKEWIDDNIIWYIWDKPIHIYKEIRHWFKLCVCNKYYWKQLKMHTFNCFPYDECYFFEGQYQWLNYAIDYFENQCWILTQKSIDFKLKYMKLAKRMLEIYMEKDQLFKFEEELDAPKDAPYYKKIKHICIPYVNMRNRKRFPYLAGDYETCKMKFIDNMYDTHAEELYRRKALHIYNMIVQRYSDCWWD